MPHRHFLRLTVLTAFVFFIHASSLHAQRERTKVLYDVTEGPGGKISGTITGESGPMKGVTVSLISHGNVVLTTMTNDNGAYTFNYILPGMYDISFYKAGCRKRIIYEIPVVETYLTNNDLSLLQVKTLKEERNPKMDYYDKLENHKLEKM